MQRSPGTILAGVLAIATPTAFMASAMHEAPLMGGGCVYWSWRIPTFTALSFMVAAGLVGLGMVVLARIQGFRLARWQSRLASLGPVQRCDPSRLSPARHVIVEALQVRTSLASTLPIDGEQLRSIGAWMDALRLADPLATQALAGVGVEPADTVRALRSALEMEGSSARSGLAVMRIVQEFFARLQTVGSTMPYRSVR